MHARIFIFDIDETLISIFEGADQRLNKVPFAVSQFNPYLQRSQPYTCITLNPDKIKPLLAEIREKNGLIGFVTTGGMTADEIRKLMQREFSIDLGNHFPFYNRTHNKSRALTHIARRYSVERGEIVLTDNSFQHTTPALQAGFQAIHADTNARDETDGTLYVQHLKALIPSQPVIMPEEEQVSDEEEWSCSRSNGYFEFFPSRYPSLDRSVVRYGLEEGFSPGCLLS